MRNKYWYYLDGTERMSFNVTVLPEKLNYIIIYKYYNSLFRVNSDLNKVTWKPTVNNFVKIRDVRNASLYLKPNISFVDSKQKMVDLTQ